MNRYITMSAAMAVFLAASAAGSALAAPSMLAESKEQKNGQDDAAEFGRLGSAKLTLADAVGAAEKNVGGKAVTMARATTTISPALSEMRKEAGSSKPASLL